MSRRVCSVLILSILVVCGLSGELLGAEVVEQPFPGITHITRTETSPRNMTMHIVRIDLTTPGIRFLLTPPGGTRETVRQTTLDFLNQVHAQVAINAHFFLPYPSTDTDAFLIGLAASNGNVYSAFESPVQNYALLTNAPAINIDLCNNASVVHNDTTFADGKHVKEAVTLWNALAGSAQIVTNGVTTIPVYRDAAHPNGELTPGGSAPYSNSDSWYERVNARTVIGLSRDKKTLFLFTVDAAGGSAGMKVGEAADLLIRDYGVHNALNLDGGGSTSLVMEDPTTHQGVIKNTSSDGGTGRTDGSNFAVFAPTSGRRNYALSVNGATATASSQHSSGRFPVSAVIDGNRTGNDWGSTGGWNDNTRNDYPDTLEVDLGGIHELPPIAGVNGKTIYEINVYTLQNNWKIAGEPTQCSMANGEGVLDFIVQYWDGSAWVAVPDGAVAGNDKAWRQFTFPAITTTRIRLVVTNARNNWSRIVELEALGTVGQ